MILKVSNPRSSRAGYLLSKPPAATAKSCQLS